MGESGLCPGAVRIITKIITYYIPVHKGLMVVCVGLRTGLEGLFLRPPIAQSVFEQKSPINKGGI